MAKLVGVGVVEFSVGFGPKLISRDIGETQYSWRLIPFGGYCAMVGENEDSDEPNAFSQKPGWARALILIGGPLFNFITSIILCAIIVGMSGANVPMVTSVSDGYGAKAAGIETGDVIRSIDGHRILLGKDIDLYLALNDLRDGDVAVEYVRDGEVSTAVIDPRYETYLIGISYHEADGSMEIASVTEGYPAEQAGIKAGDVITAVDGKEIAETTDLRTAINAHVKDGSPLAVTYTRDGETYDTTLTPMPYTGYYLGFEAGYYYEDAGFFGSIKYSFLEFGYWIRYVFTSIKMLVTGKVGLKDVSGPVGMVAMIGDTVEASMRDGLRYVALNLMTIGALLAANLGVFNLLPLPALDGGQLLIVIIEMIIRRKIPEQGKGLINAIGLTFWMALMVLILFSDVWKLVS